MIDRMIAVLASLLFAIGGYAYAETGQSVYPSREGLARLTIERADEPLLYRQDVLILLNGRPFGTLARGAKLKVDLAPGIWRVAARTRPTAEQSVLAVTLNAGTETRVAVELDASRFPPHSGLTGISNLLRESLDAPNDDRLPLFTLRQVLVEIPEGDR